MSDFDRELTERLVELSEGPAHPDLIRADGSPVRRADLLAQHIWDAAIGVERDPLTGKVSMGEPKRWAMEFVYERMEGRAPTATKQETKQKVTAADRVEELAKQQLNNFVAEVVEDEPAEPPPPPPSLKGEPVEEADDGG